MHESFLQMDDFQQNFYLTSLQSLLIIKPNTHFSTLELEVEVYKYTDRIRWDRQINTEFARPWMDFFILLYYLYRITNHC